MTLPALPASTCGTDACLDQDEELTKNEVAAYTEYTEGLIAHEKERSRTRTSDITSMAEFFTQEIDELAAAAM